MFGGNPDASMPAGDRPLRTWSRSHITSSSRTALTRCARCSARSAAACWFDKRWFAVAGDFNSLSAEPPAQTFATAGLDDVVARLPADRRWTEYFSGGGSVGQLDYLFLSPALAAATAGQQPAIGRRGIGMRDTSKTDGGPLPKLARLEVSDDLPPATSIDFRFPRFPAVTRRSRRPTTARCSSTCPDITAPDRRGDRSGRARWWSGRGTARWHCCIKRSRSGWQRNKPRESAFE